MYNDVLDIEQDERMWRVRIWDGEGTILEKRVRSPMVFLEELFPFQELTQIEEPLRKYLRCQRTAWRVRWFLVDWGADIHRFIQASNHKDAFQKLFKAKPDGFCRYKKFGSDYPTDQQIHDTTWERYDT